MSRSSSIEGDAPASLRLDASQLEAVGTLWRATGREIKACFSGRSMEPTIGAGDEVRLLCGAPLAAGDVVAYRRGDLLVLHRLEDLDPQGRWWLLRGDANLVPDHLLTDSARLVARVLSVRTAGGDERRPAAAPRGLARALVLRLARVALSLSPTLGRRCVSALRLAHGALVRSRDASGL